MRVKGKVIKWKDEKGFGFIQPTNGKPEIFFHKNCLLNQLRRPDVGDEVSFKIVTNQEGKDRAERVLFQGERDPRKTDRIFDFFYLSISFLFLFGIGTLIFFKKIDPLILIFYCLLSLITFLLYRNDKIKAQNDQWRTPENKLHFCSLIGGWPGALVAQRIFHHKSRKESFQGIYRITVILNILGVSFYCLLGNNFLSYEMYFQKYNRNSNNYLENSQNNPLNRKETHFYKLVSRYGDRDFWKGEFISVSDGDTITVLHDGVKEKIRLYGIDCPEKDQPGGREAKQLTKSIVSGRTIEIDSREKDQHGITIGLVKVDGISLNELLITNGFAWVYGQYCDESFCSDWIKRESKARELKRGIWKALEVIPPWEWRKDRGLSFVKDILGDN